MTLEGETQKLRNDQNLSKFVGGGVAVAYPDYDDLSDDVNDDDERDDDEFEDLLISIRGSLRTSDALQNPPSPWVSDLD